MSLRHILNDESVPVHRSPYPSSSRTFPSEHTHYLDDARHSPRPPSPPRSYVSQRYSPDSLGGQPFYHSATHYEPGWDSRSKGWSQEGHTSYVEGGQYAYEQDHVVSPVEPSSNSLLEDEQEDDVISKKRRKGGDEDAEYVPSKPRRV
jgi:hypothetical protein